MRQMSFALTVEPMRQHLKGVTRRYGWDDIKVGDLLQAVEKCQGLKKGEHVKKLDIIRVTAERWEPLTQMVEFPAAVFASPWTPKPKQLAMMGVV